MRRRHLVWMLAGSIALASGCSHESGPPPAPVERSEPVPPPAVPPAVTAHVGEGALEVFGASVYSPGQEIFKALRQEDSLMAFLACQGEPDRLLVRENADDPAAPPQIILEYTRRSVQRRGTVEIDPTAAGYYAARPIDPSGHLPASDSKPSADRPTHPSKPAPPPKPAAAPKPAPAPAPPLEATPDPAPAPSPRAAQPTPSQQDECPIEPWRADCRDLCVPGARWEWCSYRD